VLVARRQAELQARGRADAALHRRELVFAAQQDVADADRVALRPADAQRLGCRAEAAAGQRHRDDLTLDAHGEVGVDDREQEVDVEVVEQAVGQAERADVAVDLETVAQAVGGGAQQVARGVELLDDNGILRLEPLDAAPVELVELDVLVADVDVELPAAERIGPLEEQRAEGQRANDALTFWSRLSSALSVFEPRSKRWPRRRMLRAAPLAGAVRARCCASARSRTTAPPTGSAGTSPRSRTSTSRSTCWGCAPRAAGRSSGSFAATGSGSGRPDGLEKEVVQTPEGLRFAPGRG